MPRSRSRKRPSAEAILEAAEAAFAERGFAATSLRDLLAASSVSTTAFYARFRDKDEVLAALVQGLFDELAQAAQAALPAARSVEQGFTVGVDVLLAAIASRKGLVRVTLTEGGELLSGSYATLAGLLAGQLQGRAPDPESLGWALVGALDVQIRRWAVFGTLPDEALAPTLHATARALLPA